MKIERIFAENNELKLEDIVKSIIKKTIDKKISIYYSNLKENHATSSKKGDVV